MIYVYQATYDKYGNLDQIEAVPADMARFSADIETAIDMQTKEDGSFTCFPQICIDEIDPRPVINMSDDDSFDLMRRTSLIVESLVLTERPDLANCSSLEEHIKIVGAVPFIPELFSLIANDSNVDIYHAIRNQVINYCDIDMMAKI